MLVLLLLLLFLLFLKLTQQLLHPLFVFFGLGVVGPRLHRRLVFGDGLFPVGNFLFLVLLLLADAEQSIGQVVFRRRAQLRIFRQHGAGEILRCLVIIPEPIGRRSGVELQIGRVRFHLQPVLELLPHHLEVAFDIVRRSRPRGRQRQPQQRRSHRHRPPPLADQGLQNQQGYRRAQRPLVALDRTPRSTRGDLLFLQLPDAVCHQPLHGSRIERQIKPSRHLGNFFHARRIEFAHHHFTRGITHKLPGGNRNLRPLLRANAHGENTDPVFRRLTRGRHTVCIKFFAVRNNNHRPGKTLRFAEGLLRRADGCGNVASASRNQIRVEFIHRRQYRTMIERQRRLKKGTSGKRHQADAVTTHFRNQIFGEQFGALQTRRRDIRRQHRPRHVHGDDHIPAAMRHFECVIAESRSRQRHRQQTERRKRAGLTKPTPRRTRRAGQLLAQFRSNDAPEQGAASLLGPPKKQHPQRQKPQEIQPHWERKSQGRRLHTVCPRMISAISRVSPASTNHGNKSR